MQKISHFLRHSFLALSVCLGGCTAPVTPNFAEMSATYAGILEQYQINSILMNVVRSSLERPLSFLDMPNINGSGSINTSPNISGTLMGVSYGALAGSLSSLSPSLGVSFGNSFNFTQSSLDNATFWKGFLTEIPLETLKFFGKNHIPNEVIFTLTVDQVQIIKPSGEVVYYVNHPLRPNYERFQNMMYGLLKNGLRIDLVSVPNYIGLPQTELELKRTYGDDPISNMSNMGIDAQLVSDGQEKKYQAIRFVKGYKFCMARNEFESEVTKEFGEDIFCNKKNNNPSKNQEPKSGLVIVMRSPRNVFDFLGQVTEAQTIDPSNLLMLPPTPITFNKKVGQSKRYALFVINKNNSTPRSFASVKTVDGDLYEIPGDNNGYSPMVMDILSQLLILSKIPGSIPPSPGILIR
jgi:hypothetical protein